MPDLAGRSPELHTLDDLIRSIDIERLMGVRPFESLAFEGYNVRTFEASAMPDKASQDASLVGTAPGHIRVAALDGLTPSAKAPMVQGDVDPAMIGAQISKQELRNLDITGETALQWANTRLFNAAKQIRSRDRATTGAAIVDVDTRDGAATATVAYDCEAWVERNGMWTALVPEDAIVPEKRKLFDAWEAEHLSEALEDPEGYRDRAIEFEAVVLDDPSGYTRPPIGKYNTLIVRTVVIEPGWDKIVVASDGARLTPERFKGIDAWLPNGLREYERGAFGVAGKSTPKKFDDVTYIEISRPKP